MVFEKKKLGTKTKRQVIHAGDLFWDGEFTWPELKGWKRDLQRLGMKRALWITWRMFLETFSCVGHHPLQTLNNHPGDSSHDLY